MNQAEKVVVVLSFPRSGTHFLIDFIRKNIAGYHARLPIWASSENLYYNLDRSRAGYQPWATGALHRSAFIVKSHALPFDLSLGEHLAEIANSREVVFLTPYRAPEEILASYAAFTKFNGSITELLVEPDLFLANGETVGTNIETFFRFALDHSTFVNVAAAQTKSDLLANRLANHLGSQVLTKMDRLPRRRSGHGLLGELGSRLTGRETSEVIVSKGIVRPTWCAGELPIGIASQFTEIEKRWEGWLRRSAQPG